MPPARSRLLGLILGGAAMTALAAPGEIPVHPALEDRYYFSIGLFHPRTSTQAQLDSTTLGAGLNIDFERALGLETYDTVPNFGARMRFGNRWRLELEYFELGRSGQRRIDRDIQFGDRVFSVNTDVSTNFDFSDLRVSVGYSFFRTTDKEVGVGIGLHAASYDMSLSSATAGSQQEDVLAPLPVLSLYTQFALTPRWAISMRLDRLSLRVDKYEGSISNLGLDILYQPFKNVGFGVGHRSLFFGLTAREDQRTLHLRQSFQGPTAFMNLSF